MPTNKYDLPRIIKREQEKLTKEIETKIEIKLAVTLSGLDLTKWEEIRDFKFPSVEVDVSEFNELIINAAIAKYNSINWKTTKIEKTDPSNSCAANKIFLRFE